LNLLETFKSNIQAQQLFSTNNRLLLAVSGGVDSVVLAHLCHVAGFTFEMAHCNFKLRGAESDADAALVETIAQQYQVPLHQIAFDTTSYAKENQTNIQLAARNLRYEWFNQLLNNDNRLHCILTAHHADDNVETILMNFFKGTGLKGLQGMAAKDGGIGRRIVRPLLFAKKSALIAYAQSNNLKWREDASNESNYYTRNFCRNEILPAIEKAFPTVVDNLQNSIQRFKEMNLIFDNAISDIKKKLVIEKGDELHIPVLKLLQQPALETLVYEIIKPFGFTPNQTKDAVKLLSADSGKYISSASHRLLKNRNWIILSPLNLSNDSIFVIAADASEIDFGQHKITMQSTADFHITSSSQIVLLDKAKISFPLLLRKWKQGDYFYPLGMTKKKKLSRFFVDQKLSLIEKENTWVIESDKKIIWVLGYRIDNRFKITDQTTIALQLSLISSK